ncbi:MAG: hypothetical protein IAF38_21635 [Bacteroidia bacterium]|nr:hypothetical protein [Bacteroidia bacterium]
MSSFKILCDKKKVRPGESFPLTLEIRRRNGKTYFADEKEEASTNLKQKQNWGDFDVIVKGGSIEKGVLYVSKDMRTFSEGKNIEVTITHKILKKKTQKLIFPVDFNGESDFNFGGGEGFDGDKGKRGFRIFFREGVSGGSGSSGSDGINGEDIVVYIKLFSTEMSADTFIKVYIKSVAKDTSVVFIHNIQKFPLKISANGGDGGDGANGGTGSNGKYARDGTNNWPGRSAGNGGDGGNGGNGGNAGNAGVITIYIEIEAEKFLQKIKLENKPGLAGKAGKGGYGGSGGSGSNQYPRGQDGRNGADGIPGKEGIVAPGPGIMVVEKIQVIY